MKAVIMAAGKGIRMRPLTENIPKPMLKVGGKPILEHILISLKEFVDEVIIVVGYKSEQIKKFFKEDYYGLKISYAEQDKQLGTGHALLCAEEYLKDKFIVLNGDDFYSKEIIKEAIKHNLCAVAVKSDHLERFAVIDVENNIVVNLVEKPENPKSNLISIQCWVLDMGIFSILKEQKLSKRGEIELPEAVRIIIQNQKMHCVVIEEGWLPVGYPWHLLDLNGFLLKSLAKSIVKGEVEEGATIKGIVYIGEGTIVKSGTYIEGPVIIGENCVLGPNCYIRAHTTIGNNCKVGQAVEIKNTILFDNSKVPHLSYIGDSVIGENVNLGAGTITANLKHDSSNVKSMVNGKLVDTGRRKFGTIIGDGAKTAINTKIYPGRKIWPGKTTLPGEIIKKDVV